MGVGLLIQQVSEGSGGLLSILLARASTQPRLLSLMLVRTLAVATGAALSLFMSSSKEEKSLTQPWKRSPSLLLVSWFRQCVHHVGVGVVV